MEESKSMIIKSCGNCGDNISNVEECTFCNLFYCSKCLPFHLFQEVIN